MANRILTPGHVGSAGTAISLMAAALSIGLQGLKWTELIDGWLEAWLMRLLPNDSLFQLHPFAIWAACFVSSLGVAFTILLTPTWWRRGMILASFVVLVLGWAPVLWLAHIRPSISAVLIAVLWSGVGALIYTTRHRMPCDRTDLFESHEAR